MGMSKRKRKWKNLLYQIIQEYSFLPET
jgi:hypothetical protein